MSHMLIAYIWRFSLYQFSLLFFIINFQKMNLDDRLLIVQLFYKNNESPTVTLRAFKTIRNMNKDPFSTTAIVNLIKKFTETKSLHDAPRTGRPSLAEDRKELVLSTLETLQGENVLGHASSASVSKESQCPKAKCVSNLTAKWYVPIQNFSVTKHNRS